MDNAGIILEMLSRIQNLEKEVEKLKICLQNTHDNNNDEVENLKDYKNNFNEAKKRDTTKYLFNGAVYSKNRLVLAIVKDYVKNHKVTFKELSNIFHASLQGSIGVFERIEIAEERQDYDVRFFCNDSIRLADCFIYVCNQWGIGNITRFISRAKELDYEISEIK